MKGLIFVLVVAFGVVAQTYPTLNFTGYADTCLVKGFYSDTTRNTKTFTWNNEQKLVYVLADDTSNAGHTSDSINFFWGYQIGFPYRTLAGTIATHWSNKIVVDTLSSLTAGRLYKGSSLTSAASLWVTDSSDAITQHAMSVDTSVSNQWLQWRSIVGPWAPLIRFFATGVTGNKTGAFVKLQFGLQQRAYTVTRTQ